MSYNVQEKCHLHLPKTWESIKEVLNTKNWSQRCLQSFISAMLVMVQRWVSSCCLRVWATSTSPTGESSTLTPWAETQGRFKLLSCRQKILQIPSKDRHRWKQNIVNGYSVLKRKSPYTWKRKENLYRQS